jgi:hypothetical protein
MELGVSRVERGGFRAGGRFVGGELGLHLLERRLGAVALAQARDESRARAARRL